MDTTSLPSSSILVVFAVVETNGAPFAQMPFERLRGFEDVVRLRITLDDRHLVIVYHRGW